MASIDTQSGLDHALPPVGIIAGSGVLPFEIIKGLKAQNRGAFIIGIAGEAEPGIKEHPHSIIEWGQIGKLFNVLKREGIRQIILAGGVDRPAIQISKMDFGALLTVPSLLSALLGGDNTILSGVIGIFEKRGYHVCGVAELMPELLCRQGPNTSQKPGKAELASIAEGIAVTESLGTFDIGQACIVVGRRAVAVEGIEGTDSMLGRVQQLRAEGRMPANTGGVLVKRTKPGQDERVDLPTIGPKTIENAAAAGLKGIGVEAGKSIIVERDETLALARKHKIFIYGFDASQPVAANG